MKLLLLSLVVYCAVKCDDVSNNYYVIEMPEEVRDKKEPFNVYWNVPTMQCKSKKVPFENLYKKFGIIQNDDDKFRGEKITILYEPGLFPAIFKNETSGKYRFRNGGVPQEGNLDEHLTAFKKDVDTIIPDQNFSGIGIIDFESWRPIFRQNFGTLVPYKDVSYEIEKKLHWWWPKPWIQTEAQQCFEKAARTFMQTTLSIAKQMRPKASWGYYGFPHCFNMQSLSNLIENCPSNVVGENDMTYWLWSESTALYPSVYSSRNLSTAQLGQLVKGRVKEAQRVKRYNTPILPYFWFRYRDGDFMKQADLNIVLQTLQETKASGFIIWGSSNDVNTVDKCKKLYQYVETVLGPTISKYVQKINRIDDVTVETPIEIIVDDFNQTLNITSDIITTTLKTILNETSYNNETTDVIRKGEFDPEFDWIPPENYTEDISQNVEKELLKKGYNRTNTEDRRIDLNSLNDSIVVDMIFDALLKSEYVKENNQQMVRDIQNGTIAPNNASSTELTVAPKVNNEEKNMFITKKPNFFDQFLKNEIILHDEIISGVAKENIEAVTEKEISSEAVDSGLNVTENIESILISLHENQTFHSALEDYSTNDDFINSDIPVTTENNTVNDNLVLKGNNNYIMKMIFDALFNSKTKEINEVDQHSDQSEIKSTENSEFMSTTDITDTDYVSTTTESSFTTSENCFTDNEDNLEKENKEIATEINVGTTVSEFSYYEEISNSSNLNDMLLNEDLTNSSTEIDDFFIFLTNSTQTDFDTTTEESRETGSDDLIILAVNLNYTINSTDSDEVNRSFTVEEQITTESSDLNSEANNLSTLESAIDSSTIFNVFMTESDENEYFKESTESDKSEYTTEPTDQVVASSSTYGWMSKSIFICIVSSFIFILLV